LNTRGGRDYWLFQKRQSYGIQTEVNGVYQPTQSDIEHAQGYIFEMGRDATPRLVMGAHVPIEDLKGIEQVMYSPNVLMLVNPLTWQTDTTGPVWQVVRPLPGTFKIRDTDQRYGNIEITVELPFINIQSV
jgi:hypothetical protein